MISRNGNEYVIDCDSCSNQLEVEEYSWEDMITTIKSHGWRVKQSAKQIWEHFCPNCS
jgi:hypothetical protein